MRSLRLAVAGAVLTLSALACGDAGPPPAAPGVPIDPPKQNEDLAKMMEATPAEPASATPPPAAEPQPTASASAPPAAAAAPEKKPAEKKPAEKKPAEKK